MLKIGFLTLTAFLCLKSTSSLSQNQTEKTLFEITDKELSSGNSPLNNGKFHINNDNTIGDEHRYFSENRLHTEEIKFNNQVYYNNKIKYDIFKDDLLLNPENQSEKLLIVLDKSKVAYFTIQNRKFIPLQLSAGEPAHYVEESIHTKRFTFYIRFRKTAKEVIRENGVFVSYENDNTYFVKTGNTLTEIKSKKNIVKLYPELQSEIHDYYRFYKTLEKENPVKFMENLMLTIKKSLNN